MAIDGKIVDEINGLIASRNSIRTTMTDANIASGTSKLAELATNLSNAKLPATTYNVSASGKITIPQGKLTTGDQTIIAEGLASQTPGTATAGDILSGKTAWVNGAKVTGNIATYAPPTITITNQEQTLSTSGKFCTGNITIPAVNYYYTSTNTPSDEDGNNGDIWMVTV